MIRVHIPARSLPVLALTLAFASPIFAERGHGDQPQAPVARATNTDEGSAIAAVTNLKVTIAGMASFRPNAISRVGFDVPVVVQPGQPFSGQPTFPAITMTLGVDAPIAQLKSLWSASLQGIPQRLDMTITLQGQGATAFVDVVGYHLENALVTGFSDGSLSPASLRVQPSAILIDQVTTSGALFSQLDLDVQASPQLRLAGALPVLSLHRLSGGTQHWNVVPAIDENFKPTYQPTTLASTDLGLTAVARIAGLKAQADLLDYAPLETWLNDLGGGMGLSIGKDIELNLISSTGQASGHVIYEGCLVTRVSLINPLLVDLNLGRAPYVYDLTLRPFAIVVE